MGKFTYYVHIEKLLALNDKIIRVQQFTVLYRYGKIVLNLYRLNSNNDKNLTSILTFDRSSLIYWEDFYVLLISSG